MLEVPKDEFAKQGEIAASVFFTTVFRSRGAETALNVLVLLSAFGNLLAVLIGSSRVIREIGRYVPWDGVITSSFTFSVFHWCMNGN